MMKISEISTNEKDKVKAIIEAEPWYRGLVGTKQNN